MELNEAVQFSSGLPTYLIKNPALKLMAKTGLKIGSQYASSGKITEPQFSATAMLSLAGEGNLGSSIGSTAGGVVGPLAELLGIVAEGVGLGVSAIAGFVGFFLGEIVYGLTQTNKPYYSRGTVIASKKMEASWEKRGNLISNVIKNKTYNNWGITNEEIEKQRKIIDEKMNKPDGYFPNLGEESYQQIALVNAINEKENLKLKPYYSTKYELTENLLPYGVAGTPGFEYSMLTIVPTGVIGFRTEEEEAQQKYLLGTGAPSEYLESIKNV